MANREGGWSRRGFIGSTAGAAVGAVSTLVPGRVFAHGAQVVQNNTVLFLQTHEDAVEFNSALPCSGKIVEVKTDKDTATATFVLGDRKASRCDSPGAKATAAVKVLHGKIVLWHQLPSPQPLPPPPV